MTVQPPWVLCWHTCVCRGTTCRKICVKLVLVKIFWWTFFCLLAVLLRNPIKSKEKTLQLYFTLWFTSLSEKRQKKHHKLSTGGSSFHFKSALKGLINLLFIIFIVLIDLNSIDVKWKRLTVDAPPATSVVKVPSPQSPFAMRDGYTHMHTHTDGGDWFYYLDRLRGRYKWKSPFNLDVLWSNKWVFESVIPLLGTTSKFRGNSLSLQCKDRAVYPLPPLSLQTNFP